MLAFITPFGYFQLARMLFETDIGPPVFQREYDRTLGSMAVWAQPYINDLIIADNNQ